MTKFSEMLALFSLDAHQLDGITNLVRDEVEKRDGILTIPFVTAHDIIRWMHKAEDGDSVTATLYETQFDSRYSVVVDILGHDAETLLQAERDADPLAITA